MLPSLSFAFTSAPFLRSRSTTAVFPLWAAECSAVLPSLFFASVSAPFLRSRSTTSVFPMGSRVQRSMPTAGSQIPRCLATVIFLALISAPFLRSWSTTAVFPFLAAQSSGVAPYSSFVSILVPLDESAATSVCYGHGRQPNDHGVWPRLFFALISAPRMSRCATTSVFPYLAAQCSGVSPSLPFALISAPFFSSRSTTSIFPFQVAQCSGVSPSLSFALISAPCSSSSFTASVFPLLAAQCSGVPPNMVFAWISAPCSSSRSYSFSISISDSHEQRCVTIVIFCLDISTVLEK